MSSKKKLKCVACGHNIYKTDTILGLMPRGQITELKRKQCKFYTNNDIKFVWQKNHWIESKVGCYGCITHTYCWDQLKDKLGIQVTFEDINKHIDNNNQLFKIEYLDSLEDTWKNFILYKSAALKRRQCCDRFKKMRLRDTNTCLNSVRLYRT